MRDWSKLRCGMRPERIISAKFVDRSLRFVCAAMNPVTTGRWAPASNSPAKRLDSALTSMIPWAAMRCREDDSRMMTSSIDVIIQPLAFRDGARRNQHITNSSAWKARRIHTESCSFYEILGEDARQLIGSASPTGIGRPICSGTRARRYGKKPAMASVGYLGDSPAQLKRRRSKGRLA